MDSPPTIVIPRKTRTPPSPDLTLATKEKKVAVGDRNLSDEQAAADLAATSNSKDSLGWQAQQQQASLQSLQSLQCQSYQGGGEVEAGSESQSRQPPGVQPSQPQHQPRFLLHQPRPLVVQPLVVQPRLIQPQVFFGSMQRIWSQSMVQPVVQLFCRRRLMTVFFVR